MRGIENLALTFLLNSLWQAPLAAAVAAVVCRLMRSGPARHRHAVCVAGLVLALALPVASMRQWKSPAQTVAVAAPVLADTGAAAGGGIPHTKAAGPLASRSVALPAMAASAALWMLALFLAIRIGRLAWAGSKTLRICRAATVLPLHAELAARCAEALGVRSAELRWSADISGPVTAGRLVILPESMADAPEEVLATAIGHEMAHIARHDFTLNLVYELMYLPLSFQPAAFWLRREIDRTRELACDELVTERLLEPRSYAQSMMTIAATMAGLARPGHTLGVFDGDILEERIKRLLARPAANLKRARLMLAMGLGSLAVCLIIASGLAISARAQSPAQGEIRAGVEAVNAGNFASAIQHFRNAIQADPNNVNARLHLANAMFRQVNDPKEAQAAFDATKQIYEEVLARDPYNAAAISALAAYGGPQDAKKWHDVALKMIQQNASNANSYYLLGALDWQMAYGPIHAAQKAAGMPVEAWFIPDAAVRKQLRDQYGPTIEEGFRMLQIALGREPKMDAAMAYMNLLFRCQAAIVQTPAESTQNIALADQWVGKAIAAMKARKAQPPAPLDPDAPPPTPTLAIPAPPPPPPPGTAPRPSNPQEGKHP
jgi:beta-lactamase regulating signal transducer with metallopeptidase domain